MSYTCPNAVVDKVFVSCLGENQDFPGVYTDASGAVKTYTQPAESLGSISTMPYEPKVPASSSCTTYESSALFAALATVTAPGASSASATGSTTAGSSGSKTTTTASATSTSGAQRIAISGLSFVCIVLAFLS
ncbi:hypothetical protein C8J56DRAFT_941876 [Mycena floridula]|nr:hypothetical protein C8J56DRAFT_941876 [Mycena floridula]